MILVTTEIAINAHIGKVWQILYNFKEYKNWNPLIQHIDGQLVVGNSLHVEIVNQKKSMRFKPIILCVSPQQEIRWVGKLVSNSLFRGEHYFKLVDLGNNQTQFIHGEVFSGLLTHLMGKKFEQQMIENFNQMNQALKKKSEAA